MNRGDEVGHPACFRSNQMQRRRPAAHRAGDEAAVEACELATVLDGEREQPGVGDLGDARSLSMSTRVLRNKLSSPGQNR